MTSLKTLVVCITVNYEEFERRGATDLLTGHLRNGYAGQDARVGTRRGTIDEFKPGKGKGQDCTLSLCLREIYTDYTI